MCVGIANIWGYRVRLALLTRRASLTQIIRPIAIGGIRYAVRVRVQGVSVEVVVPSGKVTRILREVLVASVLVGNGVHSVSLGDGVWVDAIPAGEFWVPSWLGRITI